MILLSPERAKELSLRVKEIVETLREDEVDLSLICGNDDSRHQKKPMLRISLDGISVVVFPSLTACAKSIGKEGDLANIKANIRACANGRYHSAYGYSWQRI